MYDTLHKISNNMFHHCFVNSWDYTQKFQLLNCFRSLHPNPLYPTYEFLQKKVHNLLFRFGSIFEGPLRVRCVSGRRRANSSNYKISFLSPKEIQLKFITPSVMTNYPSGVLFGSPTQPRPHIH